MVGIEDVIAARARIQDSVIVTPCAYSEALSDIAHGACWLKLENLQRTGSFKERGAGNKLLLLSPEERKRGVVCASAGNHAQGVACQAARIGIDAVIVMPERTPLIKIQNTRRFGAKVILAGGSYDEAYDEAQKIREHENRVFVHPFDDDATIAGQGTVGLELLEQVPDLDAVVVAIGGGGLAAGLAVAMKASKPNIEIYGVQTRQLSSMKEALRVGHPVRLEAAGTMAEGIAVRKAGDKTFEILRDRLSDVALVDDEEIAEAILFLLEREKTVAEGAGAASVAAVLSNKLPLANKRTAIVLCGGNIDVTLVSRIIERGLVKSGRMLRVRVRVPDVSGALVKLANEVANTRANIVEIHHERGLEGLSVSEVVIELKLETRGFDHVEELKGRLLAAGYTVETR